MKTIWFHKMVAFLTRLVRSRVGCRNLESAYAQMGKDQGREKEALEWAEATFKDVANEAR
jgi:hypothetical protein